MFKWKDTENMERIKLKETFIVCEYTCFRQNTQVVECWSYFPWTKQSDWNESLKVLVNNEKEMLSPFSKKKKDQDFML